MKIDLKSRTAKQALGLAKGLSGKNNEILAEEMGQDVSTVKRYFNENDLDYYPSLPRLPRLCKALENSILLDWIGEQLEAHYGTISIDTETDLLLTVNRIASEMGEVHSTVDSYLASERGQSNIKNLIRALCGVEHQVKELRKGLQRMNGELTDEGWEYAEINKD